MTPSGAAQCSPTRGIRGARRLRDVDAPIRGLLEAGAESRTHIEQMAIDFGTLAETVLPANAACDPRLRNGGFITRMKIGGELAWACHGDRLFDLATQWTSDTCRGWAAFAVPLTARPLREQLNLAARFADDGHFAVREWAWLGVRPTVSRDPVQAVIELSSFAQAKSERVRRFASEVSRPRGVWSTHIPQLKTQPELATELLDILALDESRYVATSVGNWLNDAARSRPDFVIEFCARWIAEDPVSFARAHRLALRNIKPSR